MQETTKSAPTEAKNTILLHHFKQLDAAYGLNKTVVNTQELADILYCSTRNVSKIMKSLAALDWINWQAGRGRGIKSTIQLKRSFDEVLCKKLLTMVSRGALSEASQFAEIFHYKSIFKEKLPEWIAKMPEHYGQSDELISLVYYKLPHCHPLYMDDLRAGIYVAALFDTLIKFDAATQAFTPHLAHQFYQEGNRHYFRIRPDVYFHNGELLTPEHIKTNLLARKSDHSIGNPLFNSIEQITIDLQWVVVTLTHNDPIFLHAISDIHSAIFLTNPSKQYYPFGTGAYQWESQSIDHWSLLKNKNYFGLHGVLKRADFWCVPKSGSTVVGHLQQQNDTNKKLKGYKIKGCEALCLHHRLQDKQRETLTLLAKHVMNKHIDDSQLLTNSLLDTTLMPFYASSDFDDPERLQQTLAQIKESTLTPFRYWHKSQKELQPLLDFLMENDIPIESVEQLDKADFWLNDFLYSDNEILDHYYWLLCSAATKSVVNAFKRDQLLSEIKTSTNLKESLQIIERTYINQHRVIPMWVKSTSIKTDGTLHGVEVDSIGLLRLSELWFDKRNS